MIGQVLTTPDWNDGLKSELSEQVRELTERYPLYPFLGVNAPATA